MKRSTAVHATAPAVAAVLLVGGCSSERSALAPRSDTAERAATLGWTMIVAATIVTAGVLGLLVYGLVRRRDGRGPPLGRPVHWIVGGGIVLPLVVIAPIAVLGVTALDEEAHADLEVEVTGHQYWWEYRYPQLGVVTANELHLPVDRSVRLVLRSDDVIHSFWVPRLAGKTDLVPGRANAVTLRPDATGVYQGQCAEYCGLQHARMRLRVVVDSTADFDRWVAAQRADAAEPTGDAAVRGAGLFASQGCASCHTVRGTGATGRLGPDLTHFAGRATIAAGSLDNTHENLLRWIGETQDVKPGAYMPELPLSDGMVEDLVAYLESLE